ncbi:MAG TPA: ATP-binding protein [Bacteroidales bacterium]|nr:ATP-binding protein [Bacteroidales bacterium]
MSSYIKKLIQLGEGQHLDFKFEISDSRKIARTLAAFANTHGGTLLIGVKDNGSIAGVRSEEEYYMVQGAANVFCRPEVKFLTHEWQVDGKTVLEITVPASNKELYSAQDKDGTWKVYLRINDQNLLANRVYLQARKRREGVKGVFLAYTDREKLLLSYLSNNFNITLSQFCRIGNIQRRHAEATLANLLALDVIEQIITEAGCHYILSDSTTPFEYREPGYLKW